MRHGALGRRSLLRVPFPNRLPQRDSEVRSKRGVYCTLQLGDEVHL